jgi:hypothetical protein
MMAPVAPVPEPEVLEPPCPGPWPLVAPVAVLAPVPPRPSGVLEEQERAAQSSRENAKNRVERHEITGAPRT